MSASIPAGVMLAPLRPSVHSQIGDRSLSRRLASATKVCAANAASPVVTQRTLRIIAKAARCCRLAAPRAIKGSGFAAMVEVLCGLLTGLGFGVEPTGRHNDGCFMAVFNVAAFRPLQDFKKEVAESRAISNRHHRPKGQTACFIQARSNTCASRSVARTASRLRTQLGTSCARSLPNTRSRTSSVLPKGWVSLAKQAAQAISRFALQGKSALLGSDFDGLVKFSFGFVALTD